MDKEWKMSESNSTLESVNSTFNSSWFNNAVATNPSDLSIGLVVLAGLASFITVCGNTLVIISFIINRSLRNFSNYMILSLAMADLIIGGFSMNVYIIYNMYNKWILGSAMCKAWLTVDYTASNASATNLLVICVERLVMFMFVSIDASSIQFDKSKFLKKHVYSYL